MIAEFGQFCVILSWMIAGAQAFLGLRGSMTSDQAMMVSAARCAAVQALLCVCAFTCLIICYISTDLSVLNVFSNSHTDKPLLYKISGAWGNHEGSLLLWVTLLAGFGFFMGRGGDVVDKEFRARAVGIQALLGFGFLGFMILTSNPFERMDPAPLNGQDLNPLLQDPGLAFHPPLLYLGYVGFSVAFSFAVAALLGREIPAGWASVVRPWILFAWTSLGAGIGLGSWWAYYELGWGGWWFWDPVENASLLPWLVGTALLHSLIVTQARGALVRWALFLSILAFTFSMLGTFLVRSGILTSVHAFATDPERGMFVLLLVFLYSGMGFWLFAVRTGHISEGKPFAPLSRESFIVINNLFLIVATATVFIGTIYPIFVTALDLGQISVGPPYFEATFVPLVIPMIFLAGIAPFIAWRRGKASQYGLMFIAAVIGVVVSVGCLYAVFEALPICAIVGFAVGAWLAVSSALAVWKRKHALRAGFSFWAMILGHLGLGVAIIGMVGTSILKVENMAVLNVGDTLDAGRYQIEFQGTELISGENYYADRGRVIARLLEDGSEISELSPEKRVYPVAQSTTTEAAIYTSVRDDLYIALGAPQDDQDGAWVVRAFSHPLVALLWGGFALIVLAGCFAMVGAVRRKGVVV